MVLQTRSDCGGPLYQVLGTPSFVLAGKLKALKNDLKKSNMEVFGNINDRWNIHFQELLCFEEKDIVGTLLVEDKARKLDVVTELEKILL